MDRFGQRVYSVAYHFTLKREDAEELSQEIFLKTFENLHRYDGSYPLVAWVVSLARNLCIDRYRRRKREKLLPLRFSDEASLPRCSSPTTTRPRRPPQKERTKLLFWALAEIPEDLAEILVPARPRGLAYDEIGKALDLPDGTVKSRLFRARAEVARQVRERHEKRGTAGAFQSSGPRGRRSSLSCGEIEASSSRAAGRGEFHDAPRSLALRAASLAADMEPRSR